jgi:uncharacterized protein YceK
MRILATALSLLLLTGCASVVDQITAGTHFEAAYTPSTGNSRQAAFDEVKARLESWGYTIILAPQEGTIGRLYWAEKLIFLNPALDVDGLFEVLTHEAGHIFQPPVWSEDGTRADAEVFAEMVSLGVGKFYGFDLRSVSVPYLRGYKSGLAMLKYHQRDIDMAVKAITGQITVRFTF